MELGIFWRSIRQRWSAVVLLMILTGAATYAVAQRVGPTYEATGTVLVFPPAESRGPTGTRSRTNPYLGLGGVNQARDVIVRTLTSKSVGDEFGQEFPSGTMFEVVPDYTNSAPIILFTVESTTPETSVAALDMLMTRVPDELSDLQAGLDLPQVEQVSSQVLTADERPATTRKAQIRAAILGAAVVGGSGLLLIALVDGLLAGRRREASAGDPPASMPPDENQPGEPHREVAIAVGVETPHQEPPPVEVVIIPPAAELRRRARSRGGKR